MRMFKALPPYYGNKRKLCPIIFSEIHKRFPRDKWQRATFVDGFMGSGAVSLYAKAQGFKVIANDVARRSYITGMALVANNETLLKDEDIYKLFLPNPENRHLIERDYVPDVFTQRHAQFLDNAFPNATRYIDQYLLLRYIFRLRPYSKFSSPNAFGKPMSEGRYDEIKPTYINHIKDNLKAPLEILKTEAEAINTGIFSNGYANSVYQKDVFEFVDSIEKGIVFYADPPYSSTMSYENEYSVLDRILGDEKPKSKFSNANGMDMLDALLAKADKFPMWVISYGNAGGQNDLNKLMSIVSKYRKCEAREFLYRHCEAVASQQHKDACREWLLIGCK